MFHRGTQKTIPKACTCISFFNQPGQDFGQVFEKRQNAWSYLADRLKPAEISARSIENGNMTTEMGTYDSREEQGTQEQWHFNMVCNVI